MACSLVSKRIEPLEPYAVRDKTPVVIVLVEGLETQYWRINNQKLKWVSVDVPEAIVLREKLLPHEPNLSALSFSALLPAWMDHVQTDAPPFISAAGLLMYFKETEIRQLLGAIADRFPGAELFFDTITPMVSRKTLKGAKITKHYTAPPTPWGIQFDDIPACFDSLPGWSLTSAQTHAEPYPNQMVPYNSLTHIGPIRRAFAGSLVHAKAA